MDYINCDHDEWDFANVDPNIHSAHRDAHDELVDTCHYGEWGGDAATGNSFAFTYFTLTNADDSAHIESVIMNVEARIWGFCNFQNSDRIELVIYDEYTGDLLDDEMKLEYATRYSRQRTVWSKGKKDNSCSDANPLYNWDVKATAVMPDWLDQVSCTTLRSEVSCYTQLKVTEEITGGVLGLMFRTTMDDTIDMAAWAFSNIELSFPSVENCCVGTHSNPNKKCESLHEVRNCENKGCTWNANADVCNLDCCRYADSGAQDNMKPKCKNINYYFPDRSECIDRDDCLVSQCDRIGQMDGILNL
jgi:hypothetical protein